MCLQCDLFFLFFRRPTFFALGIYGKRSEFEIRLVHYAKAKELAINGWDRGRRGHFRLSFSESWGSFWKGKGPPRRSKEISPLLGCFFKIILFVQFEFVCWCWSVWCNDKKSPFGRSKRRYLSAITKGDPPSKRLHDHGCRMQKSTVMAPHHTTVRPHSPAAGGGREQLKRRPSFARKYTAVLKRNKCNVRAEQNKGKCCSRSKGRKLKPRHPFVPSPPSFSFVVATEEERGCRLKIRNSEPALISTVRSMKPNAILGNHAARSYVRTYVRWPYSHHTSPISLERTLPLSRLRHRRTRKKAYRITHLMRRARSLSLTLAKQPQPHKKGQPLFRTCKVIFFSKIQTASALREMGSFSEEMPVKYLYNEQRKR